jgi:galactokinase
MIERLKTSFRALHARDPEFIAYAPGRIEVIGNHTDYNGGSVLGAAIDLGVCVGLARRTDGLRRFGSDQRPGVVELPAGNLDKCVGARAWVNYPLGVIHALRDSGLAVPEGFDYAAVSNLPAGAGLSSSAAIELSSCLVFSASTGTTLPIGTLVAVAKRAENEFVGVPCGILDQGVSAYGHKDKLVYIDCKGPRFDTVPLPAGSNFWIFNTHAKHALIDGLYAERHSECMEAAKAIDVGLLVEATPAMLAAAVMRLSRTAYKRARHVIEEIARVEQAVGALRSGDMGTLGKLLLASHRSSRTLFENSCPELDFLVDSLESEKGVFGARLTGGGFGGAAMALTDDLFGEDAVRRVSDAYFARFGSRPEVLHTKTGEGAALVTGGR